jgi:hypothetical protein
MENNTDSIETQDTNNTHESEKSNAKIDLLILNNGWNDNNERLIVSIGENAASYKWMHEKCSSKNSNYSKILGIIIIMVNAGLSAQTLFTGNGNNPCNTNNSDKYDPEIIVQKVFIWSVTLLSIIQNFLNYEKTSSKHASAAASFSELYHDIQKQMCMYRKDRINAVKYISGMMKKYDSLELAGPDIDKKVLNEFKNKFKDQNIIMPNIADKIQKIDIITEPSNGINGNDNNNKNFNNNFNNNFNIKSLKTHTYESNLSHMNNCFKINGDLEEHDIPTYSKRLRDAKIQYELSRFEEHTNVNEN